MGAATKQCLAECVFLKSTKNKVEQHFTINK